MLEGRYQVVESGCWEWTLSLFSSGYPRVWSNGRSRRAHRVSYEQAIGPIPEGLVLDHLCRNIHCINPSHLEAVTNRENILRGEGHAARNARKTHCPKDHEYNMENTYYHAKTNNRQCKICREARQ